MHQRLDNAPRHVGAATWFVDPPYDCRAGSRYRKGRRGIDYADLGTWTRQRPGQVIACEQLGASWLPFTELARVNGMRGKGTEVYWLSTGLPVKSQLPLLLGESGQMMEVG